MPCGHTAAQLLMSTVLSSSSCPKVHVQVNCHTYPSTLHCTSRLWGSRSQSSHPPPKSKPGRSSRSAQTVLHPTLASSIFQVFLGVPSELPSLTNLRSKARTSQSETQQRASEIPALRACLGEKYMVWVLPPRAPQPLVELRTYRPKRNHNNARKRSGREGKTLNQRGTASPPAPGTWSHRRHRVRLGYQWAAVRLARHGGTVPTNSANSS